MKEYEIKITDLQRILLGEVPLPFYLELIFRAAVIYLILMVSLRFMGKRMSGQLSRNEMAAVASLAAAIGIPLMNPDKGILPAVIIAIVIIFYQTLIAKKAARNKQFESLTQDDYSTLVRDGVLDPKVMMRTRITKDRIFSQLRSEGFSHLGMVKRMYFEAGGNFSILGFAEPKAGLSILPEWDKELSSDLHLQTTRQVCHFCGKERQNTTNAGTSCSNCKHDLWVESVTNRD
jgi:uncharacterized membrane protein YcaP (DUF421 family)